MAGGGKWLGGGIGWVFGGPIGALIGFAVGSMFDKPGTENVNKTTKRTTETDFYYKNRQIGTRRVDFLIENVISVELKAIVKLEDVHFAQAINYLEAYDLEVGLLSNFGAMSLEFKRLLNSKFKQKNQDNPQIK